jgi:drug/metabolite transporter (DMT)-like permease
MTWFHYALLAAAAFTAYSLIIRIFLHDHGDALIFALLTNVVLGTTLLMFALVGGWYLQPTNAEIALILVGSVFYASASSIITWGRQLEEASRVSVARQSAIIWVFAGGVMILGETFTLAKLGGIALILIGTLLAFWDRGHFTTSKGIVLVLIGSLLASGSDIIATRMVESTVSPALYAATISLLAALWLFMALPRSVERIRDEIRLQRWRIGAAGTLLGLSIFLLMRGFQIGEASRVAPVYNLSLIFTVLAGIVLLGERTNTHRKVGGAFVALAGAMLLRVL